MDGVGAQYPGECGCDGTFAEDAVPGSGGIEGQDALGWDERNFDPGSYCDLFRGGAEDVGNELYDHQGTVVVADRC